MSLKKNKVDREVIDNVETDPKRFITLPQTGTGPTSSLSSGLVKLVESSLGVKPDKVNIYSYSRDDKRDLLLIDFRSEANSLEVTKPRQISAQGFIEDNPDFKFNKPEEKSTRRVYFAGWLDINGDKYEGIAVMDPVLTFSNDTPNPYKQVNSRERIKALRYEQMNNAAIRLPGRNVKNEDGCINYAACKKMFELDSKGRISSKKAGFDYRKVGEGKLIISFYPNVQTNGRNEDKRSFWCENGGKNLCFSAKSLVSKIENETGEELNENTYWELAGNYKKFYDGDEDNVPPKTFLFVRSGTKIGYTL